MLFLEPERALVWTLPPASPGTQIATLKANDAWSLHLWRPGLMHSLAPDQWISATLFSSSHSTATVAQVVIVVFGY